MKSLEKELNELNFSELKETLCEILNERCDYALKHRKLFEEISDELSENKNKDFSQYGLMSASIGLAALMLLRKQAPELDLDDQLRISGVSEFFKNIAMTLCVGYGLDQDYVEEKSYDIGAQIYSLFSEERVDTMLQLMEEKKRD